MKILMFLLLICLAVSSPAQILKKLKDNVTNKAKVEVGNAKHTAKNKIRDAARKELDDFNAVFDSTDIDYAILLSDNSGLFGGKGRGEFVAKFRQLGGIANSLFKDADLTDEENARLNLQLGQSGYATSRFVYAEKRLNAAKGFFEKAYLVNDAGYIKNISSLGLLYISMGRYEQAKKSIDQSLALRENMLGKKSMAVAASLNNKAVLQFSLGQYNESEKKFEEALALINGNMQNGSVPYTIVINNKAILLKSIGRFEEAVKLLEEAIRLNSKTEVRKIAGLAKFYSNLALLYQEMGKYKEAEKIYTDLKTRLDNNSLDYANLLNNIAVLYIVMKNDDKVVEMLKSAAGIYKTLLGETSPAYSKVISDLGNFLRYKGNYLEAAPMLEEVLKNREKSLGVDHPLYVQSQEDLAILYWKKNDFKNAYPLYHSVMEKSLDFINKYFPPMSEAEKTKYWDLLSPRFQRFFNFAIEASAVNSNAISDLFEYRLATKGLLLSSSRKVSESILASGNQQLINEYSRWIDQKEQLTNLYAYTKEELKEQSINLDSLEKAANSMEKKLSENSKEFAQFYFTSKTTISEIQGKLKADEALIEIIRLRNFEQVLIDSCRYIGIVVTKGSTQPSVIILPNGTNMEGKFAKLYRLSMKNKMNDEKSYANYWEPFEKDVKEKNKIYVSLDGVYNQVNLYTLKKPGGDFLINQKDIILLGNAKDIFVKSNVKNKNSVMKAALIGFPYYGSPTIPELPATKTEVDGINKVLKTSGYQVSSYMQKDATESNLKQTQKISILHIATHGYFLQDVEKASWPIGVSADNAKGNVLLRSGLMLTGASDAEKHTVGLENNSNGILTSYEAMNLDLEGTNLVVLSACETGLGEVKAGEGVYGLQRAFLAAGAEAIIMSLWKVDDAATQQLMNNFYTNWTKSGDIEKAFKQAQQQLITKYKEPFYWGAFVMMEN